MLGGMCANFVKIAIDISSIAWRILPQFGRDFKSKGCLAALGNAILATFWDVPHAVMQDIWRIVRSPFYATGMMFACMYTIVRPFEGRVWIGKIETLWHEGAPHRMDLRYRGKDRSKDLWNQSLKEKIEELLEGKFLFLSYCMLKRGNINDEVAGKPRFRRITS